MKLEILEQYWVGEYEYRTVYKCPCGKGTITDVEDETPGFKCHDDWINCPNCEKKYTKTTNNIKYVDWDKISNE